MSDYPELHVKIFGLSIIARGALAIGAATIIVFAVLGFYWF